MDSRSLNEAADNAPYSSTLGKGLDVLEFLSSGPCGSQTIADSLDLNRSTAYRLVQTLVAHGLVQRHDDGISYALTSRLWELGAKALGPQEIRAAASRAVTELSRSEGETVHLAIYDSGEVVYIDKADSWQPIGSYTQLGGRAPAYAVATGKALLAHQGRAEIESVMDGELVEFTPHTFSKKIELEQELVRIRENGFAVNEGEWREDVGGIAVAIFDATRRPVAALGFSGPVDRLFSRQDSLLRLLQQKVSQISVDSLGPS